MVMTITLDKRQVDIKLNTVLSGLKNTKPLMKEIGQEAVTYFSDEVFQSQGREITGGAWRPLAISTLSARQRRSGYYKNAPEATGKTLIWTGKLRRGFIDLVEATKVTITNRVPYFEFHQLGGGKLKQRKMLSITQKLITIVTNKSLKYINKLIK